MVIRESSAPASARPERSRRGMRARLRRSATFGFSVRLCLAIAATFAVLGTAGYLMVGDQLQRRLLAAYAGEHRADTESFIDEDLRSPDAGLSHERIGRLLSAIGRRPGVMKAKLVGPDGVLEAADFPSSLGQPYTDAHIDAALRSGRSSAAPRRPAPATRPPRLGTDRWCASSGGPGRTSRASPACPGRPR